MFVSDVLKHSAAGSQVERVGCGYPLFDDDGRYLLNGHLLLEFDALNTLMATSRLSI